MAPLASTHKLPVVPLPHAVTTKLSAGVAKYHLGSNPWPRAKWPGGQDTIERGLGCDGHSEVRTKCPAGNLLGLSGAMSENSSHVECFQFLLIIYISNTSPF